MRKKDRLIQKAVQYFNLVTHQILTADGTQQTRQTTIQTRRVHIPTPLDSIRSRLDAFGVMSLGVSDESFFDVFVGKGFEFVELGVFGGDAGVCRRGRVGEEVL